MELVLLLLGEFGELCLQARYLPVLAFWRNFSAAVWFVIVGGHPAFLLADCRWSRVALSAASARSVPMAFESVVVAAAMSIPDFFASLYAAAASLTRFLAVLSFRVVFVPGFFPSIATSSFV